MNGGHSGHPGQGGRCRGVCAHLTRFIPFGVHRPPSLLQRGLTIVSPLTIVRGLTSALCHPSDAYLVLNHPAASFPKSASSQSQRKEVVKSFALRSLLKPVHLVVEGRDRAVPPLWLWGLSACPLGCSRVFGGCLVVPSASQPSAASSPTLSPPGSPYKLHGVFCFAYSLEQTWWRAYKGRTPGYVPGSRGHPGVLSRALGMQESTALPA